MTVLARAAKETLGYEPYSSVDGQGSPSYGASVNVSAVVVERDVGDGEEYVVGPDGSRVSTPVTLYVQASESNIPGLRDRVTVGSTTYIVAEKKAYRRIRSPRGTDSMYRYRLRLE